MFNLTPSSFGFVFGAVINLVPAVGILSFYFKTGDKVNLRVGLMNSVCFMICMIILAYWDKF